MHPQPLRIPTADAFHYYRTGQNTLRGRFSLSETVRVSVCVCVSVCVYVKT